MTGRQVSLGNLGSGSFAAAVGVMFLYFLATLAVSTAVGAMLAKLFARQVPFRRLIITCFKAFALVSLLGLLGRIVITLTGMRVPTGRSAPLAIAGMCAVGWLMTRDLKIQGVPAKFPGLGAKVMTCFAILSLAVVVIVVMALGA